MSLYTVIGAGGFIGGRIAARLTSRGDEVFSPGRDEAGWWDRPMGVVLYAAGLTGDFMERPFDTVEAHVSLLTQVLRAGHFDRIVYLSSTRLYDSLGAAGGREEDVLALDPALPRNVYDLSKALGENLTVTRTGGRGVAARLSNVFALDPAASGFLPDLLAQARRRRDLSLAISPDGGRDYIHADDVDDALLRLLDGDASGVVNVASGRPLLNRDLAAVFADCGWRLELTGPESAPGQAACDTSRLQSLGVRPRDPRDVIREILQRPGFFQG